MTTATAIAHPNIAFIKYWGNIDSSLRLAANSSLSMNLGGLETRTRVEFDPDLQADEFVLDGQPVTGQPLSRVSTFLDLVRDQAQRPLFARVDSTNNFPAEAGIASSASAFAALALAASTAAGLSLSEVELSRLARRGSGSASRSIPGGFVEWWAGPDDASSYAVSIAPPEHWDLRDCVAVVSRESKRTGSSEGHDLAHTSPLQAARVASTPERLEQLRQAILERDFETFADIVQLDSNLMHAVIMTSSPPLLYWLPATVAVLHSIGEWRESGLPVCYTIDAGPNVHVICPAEAAGEVMERLSLVPGVSEVLQAYPDGPARLLKVSG